MAKLAVPRPLDEGYLGDDFGSNPMYTRARQAERSGERRFGDLERVEPRPQSAQERSVEAGPDLVGKYEVVVIEVADQQRAQAHAGTARIGEAPDHELLRGFAFHFLPERRAALLVHRVASLRDDS